MLRRPVVITRPAKRRKTSTVQTERSMLENDGWTTANDASAPESDGCDAGQMDIDDGVLPVTLQDQQSSAKADRVIDSEAIPRMTCRGIRNNEGRFECSVCNVENPKQNLPIPSFARLSNFRTHRQKLHYALWVKEGGKTRTYQYACREDKCDQKFFQADKLASHLANDHTLTEFAALHQTFSSRDEYHKWKLGKLEETTSALCQSTQLERQNGDLVSTCICYRNRPLSGAAKKQNWTSCTTYIKAVEIRSESAGISGQFRVKVEYCFTHYGHDPATEADYVKKRHERLAKATEFPDQADILDFDGSLQPFDSDCSSPMQIDGFDPVSGEPIGDRTEIHRLHAEIILKLKDISISGAKETKKVLEDLHRQVGVGLEVVLDSKRKEKEGLRRRKRRPKENRNGENRTTKEVQREVNRRRTRSKPWRLVVNEDVPGTEVSQEPCVAVRNSEGRFECSVCNVQRPNEGLPPTSFAEMSNFYRHRLKYHRGGPLKCGVKGRRPRYPSRVTCTAVQNGEGLIECSVCNVEYPKQNLPVPFFPGMYSFRSHRAEYHPDLWEKDGRKSRACRASMSQTSKLGRVLSEPASGLPDSSWDVTV